MLASALLAGTIAVSAPLPGVEAPVRVGSGANSSLIYLDFGPRTYWFDVRYNASLTGFGALQLIDQSTPVEVESIPFGSGRFVTSIAYDGWRRAGTGSNGSDYWGYWLRDGSNWTYSGIGASLRVLNHGQSDGWVWTPAQPGRGPDEPGVPEWADLPDPGIATNTASRSIPEPTAACALALTLRPRRRK